MKDAAIKPIRIERWYTICIDAGPYIAPELHRLALHGVVYGHPKHDDGTEITTSAIVGSLHGLVMTKSGSMYAVGEVDPVFAELYPDAKERLLGSTSRIETTPADRHGRIRDDGGETKGAT